MWEVRVQARHRLLYGIYRVAILRAIIKDRETTAQAVRRKR